MKIGAGAVLVGVAIMLTLADARATFPGDNGLIAWSSGGDLWRAGPDGTDPSQDHDARWRPPGLVAHRRQPGAHLHPPDLGGNGDIFKMLADANGPVPVNVAANPADDRQPTYSPDGGQIVFASNRTTGGAYRLYRMPSAGGTATPITTTGDLPTGTDDDAPEWNFHNDRIVFQRGVPGGLGGSLPGDASGNTAIFSIKADGTDLQRLTTGTSPAAASTTTPTWSGPSGRRTAPRSCSRASPATPAAAGCSS